MYLNQCSLCKHANPAGARFCNACGVGLVCACLHCGVVSDAGSRACRSCGAILPDSDGPPADRLEPSEPNPPPMIQPALPDALFDRVDPIELSLNLRPIVEAPAPDGPDLEAMRNLIRSDPESFVPPPIGAVTVAVPPDNGSTKKSARRAWVRRARLANTTQEARLPLPTIDVLVFEAETGARQQLCGLLEGFGFSPVPAQTLAEATELATAQPFAAAFLDIVLDGTLHGASIELCQRVKDVSAAACGRAAAVILTSGRVKPVDRVRASLAGGDGFLVKPLGRGDVARALDACDVALPSDERGRSRR